MLMEAVMDKIGVEKYDSYKDSGEHWFGEIPKHWEVSRLGKILTPTSIKNRPALPLLSITRGKGVILRDMDDNEENHNFIPDDLSNYKVLKQGEFGMNKMKAWQGSYGISPYLGIVSPAYYTFVLDSNLVPEFFHIAIRSRLYVSYFGSASDGVRVGQWDLSKERMKQIPFLVPSIEEQTAIANFLDRKAAQIDKAIAQKEKLIELLKERRQILIHKAVTRGLDPNVKMKDSGVEWIGEIPEHWEVKKLRRCLKSTLTIKNKADLPLLSITREKGIIERDIHDQEENHNFIPEDLSNYKLIQKGQFGINKMKAWQGSYGVSAFTGIVSPAYFVFGLDSQLNPDFFHLAIRSSIYVSFFAQASDGVRIGQWDLQKSRMKDIPFITPTPSEQVQILELVDRINKKVKTAIDSKGKEIEKLQEYKTSLINAAVTGKIKVNQYQPNQQSIFHGIKSTN